MIVNKDRIMHVVSKEQGFGIIGLLLLVAIVGLIGVGWHVYTAKSRDKAYQCGVNTQTFKGGCVPVPSGE